MTRRDVLESVHEPFGDAFYYGPEFLSDRFKDDVQARESSGFSKKTYKDILASIMEAEKEVRFFFHILTIFHLIPCGQICLL